MVRVLLLTLAACGDSTSAGGATDSSTGGGMQGETTHVTVTGAPSNTESGTATDTSSETTSGPDTSTGSGSESGSPGGLSAKDDVYATGEDVVLSVPAGGVLDNDAGPTSVADFDAASVEGGIVEISSDGALEYTPPPNFWGWDQFGYTAEDGASRATATVRVFVEPAMVDLPSLGPTVPGGFVISGAGNGDNASVLAGAGDFNGNGLSDVVVGARAADPPGHVDAGTGYVVHGKSDAETVYLSELEGAMPSGGLAILGAEELLQVGITVGGSGDINGDGLADAVLTGSAGDPIRAGQVYVVFGQAGTSQMTTAEITDDPPIGGFVIRGSIEWGDVGVSVDASGDVNGDGLADVIIGAPAYAAFSDEDPDITSGRAYVVFGTPDPVAVELGAFALDPPSAGFVIVGANPGDRAGTSVAAAGDVNGDGLDDVVVGASDTGSTQGTAYVIFGKGDTANVDLDDVEAGTTAAGYAILGRGSGDRAGFWVAAAGDVDGDGLDDVAVHVFGSVTPGLHRAGVYVVPGQVDNVPVDLGTLEGGFFIDSEDIGFIASVSNAGDVNADGLDDLVVGFGFFDEVYIVYGRSVLSDVDLTEIEAGASELGLFAFGPNNSAAGLNVDRAGDVNGDGIGDIAISGAGGFSYTGETYVLFGGNFGGHLTCYGSAEADEVLGDEGIDVVATGAGADRIVTGGGGDVVYAGPGDDVIEISDAAFARIDGGTGNDVVALVGNDVTLDLSAFGARAFTNIETIDLTGRGDNTLVLEVRDIVHASSSSNVLVVDGDAGDEVAADLSGAGFSSRPGPVGYTDFTTGIVTLRVADAVDSSNVST